MSYSKPFNALTAGTGITLTDTTPTPGVVRTNVSATLGLLNYGFFLDTTTQTNPVANTTNIAKFNTTGPTNGISVVGTTAITVANAGVYTKLFTVIVAKTSSGTDTISIWLRKNGVDIPNSRQDLQLLNTLALIFTSGNFTLSMAAGDNIQLCWSSADTTAILEFIPAGAAPVRPTGASVKVTFTRIS